MKHLYLSWLALLLWVVVGWLPAKAAPPLAILADAFRTGEVVSATVSMQDIQWLAGKWECVDRALRAPRPDADLYAYLASIELESDAIFRSKTYQGTHLAGGIMLLARCSFANDCGGRAGLKNHQTWIEFHAEGFCFALPMPSDCMVLRKEPIQNPNWFVLEHKQSGDVLMFRRMPEEVDAPGNGAKAIKPGQESKPNQGTNAPVPAPP